MGITAEKLGIVALKVTLGLETRKRVGSERIVREDEEAPYYLTAITRQGPEITDIGSPPVPAAVPVKAGVLIVHFSLRGPIISSALLLK